MTFPPRADPWPELYSVPSVSTHVSIARPPSQPFEDSDVLVLSSRSTLPDSQTVRNNLLYLDLRLSLPVGPTTCKINWAFAGIRYTVPLEEQSEDGELALARYRWEHIIDSHGNGEPPDEGTLVRRIKEDGSEVAIEIGVGLDPETGKAGPYEEFWKDEELLAGTPFAFLMSGPSPCVSTEFMAVVGIHAITLSQGRRGGYIPDSSSALEELMWTFDAARLRGRKARDRFSWETVFSTGQRSLESQLVKFVEGLSSRAREGNELWKRGEVVDIKLGDGNKHEELVRKWTVWDAGYTSI
ncbi:hypothetical protein J3A83DRAFT_4083772 [Scleroderma citrinum]